MKCIILLLFLCLAGAAPTVKTAINALHSASYRWYQIGIQLEVPTHVLKNIKQQPHDQTDCLTELLEYWVRNAPPSWRALIDALRAPSVGEKTLAGELEERYCNQTEPVTHKMKEFTIHGNVEKSEGMAC